MLFRSTRPFHSYIFNLGTETLLHSILTRLQTDLAMSTSSLICLPLDNSLRKRAGEALVPQTKMKVCIS